MEGTKAANTASWQDRLRLLRRKVDGDGKNSGEQKANTGLLAVFVSNAGRATK